MGELLVSGFDTLQEIHDTMISNLIQWINRPTNHDTIHAI